MGCFESNVRKFGARMEDSIAKRVELLRKELEFGFKNP